MHPVAWFVLVLCAAAFYGGRIRIANSSTSSRPVVHWWSAAALVVFLAVYCVLIAHSPLKVPEGISVCTQWAVLLGCGWLGVRHWVHWKFWDACAALLALSLVVSYYHYPARYNNPMLAIAALGVAVGGYYVTKGWLRTFYAAMAALDAYMVWGSNLSEQLSQGPTGLLPLSLITGMLHIPFLEISVLDVVLGALAVVSVARYHSVTRALLLAIAASACTIGFALIPNMPTTLPFLVVLAPLVWLALAGRSPACS